MSEKKEYLVVLRYAEKVEGYGHIRFYTAFVGSEALHAWLLTQTDLEVVEENITQERAIALIKETPESAYFHAVISSAMSARTGEVVPEVLLRNLNKVEHAA